MTFNMDKSLSRKQRRIRAQAANDANAVLAHAPSVRFLLRIIDGCGMHLDPMAGDALTTAHNAGRRRTGLDIMAALTDADQNAHLTMLQAAAKERDAYISHEGEESDDD